MTSQSPTQERAGSTTCPRCRAFVFLPTNKVSERSLWLFYFAGALLTYLLSRLFFFLRPGESLNVTVLLVNLTGGFLPYVLYACRQRHRQVECPACGTPFRAKTPANPTDKYGWILIGVFSGVLLLGLAISSLVAMF